MAKKQFGKRALSTVLAMVMCLSLLQVTALASESGEIEYEPLEIASNGETRTVNGENGTSVSAAKTARILDDETVEITLEVETVSYEKTTVDSKAAHVVLVIDRSGSMKGTAIENAKSAARSFADIFLGENAADGNKLAVVSFAGVKGDRNKTADVTTNSGFVGKTGLAALKTQIDGISADGGTLTQAAILQAQELLNASKQEGVQNIIVLMSDGAPTYSYQLTGTATWTGCYINMSGAHRWGDGNVDPATVLITGRNTGKILGSGSSFTFSDNNAALEVTCSHGKTQSDYAYTYQAKNNGVAAVWEAGESKSAGTEIYSVLLTSYKTDNDAQQTLKSIATDVSHYYTGNADQLAGIFKTIATSVSTESGGSVLADPMSDYVRPGSIEVISTVQPEEVNVGDTALNWNLGKAHPYYTGTVGDKTTNRYKLTYQIKINRNAAFYDAILAGTTNDAAGSVPTNGTTELTYTLGQNKDQKLELKVPTITSGMPTIPYTVNYYKQGLDGTYTHSSTEGSKPYGESFHGEPQNYGNGYFFDTGTGKSNVESPATPKSVSLNTAENVINIYYSLPSYTVTVNHMLRTETLNQQGVSSSVDTPMVPDAPVTVYYGGSFDGASKIRTSTSWEYSPTVTAEKQPGQNLSLSGITESKTLTVWYYAKVDNRMDIPYTSTHHVTTHTWEKNAATGKWEEKSSTQDIAGVSGTGKYGTNSEEVQPLAGYADNLTRVEIDGNETTVAAVMPLSNPDGHKIDLYYDVPATNEPERTTYQYVHHYTLTTSTDNGSSTNTEKVEGTEISGHVGDDVKTTESDVVRSYKGANYTLETNVPFDTTLKANGNVIDLYYTANVTVPVDVRVIYHYAIYNQKINPVDGTSYYDTDPDSTLPDETETIKKLAGNLFSLTPNAAYTKGSDGFSVYDQSDAQNVRLESNKNYTYDVFCEKRIPVDPQSAGSVTVNFEYYTLTTYYDASGELKENEETKDGTSPMTYHGAIGDTFSRDLVKAYGENNDYALAAGDATADPVIAEIVSTEGSTMTVKFYRSVDNRSETSVTVTPVFVTRTAHATGEKGVFTYTESSVDGTPKTYPQGGEMLYAGQKWSAVPETVIGDFDFSDTRTIANNPYENVILGDSGNPTSIRLYYVKEDASELQPVTVVVRHFRTTNVFDVNSETLVPGTPVQDGQEDEYTGYYVGNVFSTAGTAKPLDYTVVSGQQPAAEVALSEEAVDGDGRAYVDWYYTRDSYPQTVNVIVNYKVTVKEYGTGAQIGQSVEIDGSASPYTKHVGTQFNTPNYAGYTDAQIDRIVLDSDVTTSKSFHVGESGNTVTVEYVIYQDSRQDASVVVEHNYFDLDAYTGIETPAAGKNHTATLTTARDEAGIITNGIYVGAEFTAAKDADADGYVCRTADAALTATLSAPETRLTVQYVKTTSSDPGDTAYLVRHDYYVNGGFEGSVNGAGGVGKIGSTVSGADIAPILTYNGQTYVQTGVTSAVLAAEGENIIVLSYGRTVVNPPSYNDDGDDDTPPAVIPENPTPLSPASGVPGTDVPAADIPDGTVPAADIPEEVTPLASAPKTGDSAALWILISAASGAGLIYLTFVGKKRKDEDAR